MEKQRMIDKIATRLSAIGVFFQYSAGADITVQAEFLDAAWGSGNKKIEYQASAFLNEAERTLYFWEFTKETGSGFSFGSDSESSFQSGTTLFRKVKSVGYGPDGKAYEYSLNIGAITKTFKETAKQEGWKFKVVLKREKASYPQGNTLHGVNEVPQPSQDFVDRREKLNVQKSGVKIPGKGKKFFGSLVVLLGLVTITLYGISGTSVIGWLIAAVIFALLFFAQRRMAGKGCLFDLILWILALVLLFVTFAFTTTNTTTKTSTSTVTPLQLPSQKGKAVDGKFQVTLQNMVYSYAAAQALTAQVLQVDMTAVSKADWEAQYKKALQAWQNAEQLAQAFDQLVAQLPVQVSILPETKSLNVQLVNQTSSGGERTGVGEAKFYGIADSFYNAASKTAQTIETAADVGLFVGDIVTGGGAKFSLAKAGVKNFAKTALITSVAGADLVLQIGETSTQVGNGSAETGAWISSARSKLSPFTTLLSLKSISKEGLESPGNIKTITGWGLLVADKAGANANVLKVSEVQGQTLVRGFNNPKLAEQLLNENEVSLSTDQRLLLQAVKSLIPLPPAELVPQEKAKLEWTVWFWNLRCT